MTDRPDPVPHPALPESMARNLGFGEDDEPCRIVRLVPVDESEDDW